MKRTFFGLLACTFLMGAAGAADTDLTKLPSQSFAATSVDFGAICGVVSVDVGPVKNVKVQMTGTEARLKPMHAEMQGQTLHIAGEICPPHTSTIRGWTAIKALLDGSWRHVEDYYLKKLQVHVTVPEGMALSASEVAGVLRIGDTHGALHFTSRDSGDVYAGNVASAELRGEGSGDFHLGTVAGALSANLQGSGDLSVKAAGSATCQTHGSGDIILGKISGNLKCATSGSGDIKIGSVFGAVDVTSSGSGDILIKHVAGAVHAATSGSGDIRIKDGEADPLVVRSSGSGDIRFSGKAKNVDSASSGSGDIRIRD